LLIKELKKSPVYVRADVNCENILSFVSQLAVMADSNSNNYSVLPNVVSNDWQEGFN
jgi:hypothetical protein